MTRRVMHDLGCACGRHFRRVLYHSINASQQTGLRYAVLAGVLNTVQCPDCEHIARVNLPFLYNDADHGHLIYVYPAEAEAQAGEIAGQIVQMVHALEESNLTPANLPQPTVMFGLDRLADVIRDELDDGEQPGSIAFDSRPGKRPERAARILAARVALQTGGYVHSWREGGRLHLQILGPVNRLQEITVADE